MKAIRGMNDILPHQTTQWRHIEGLLMQACQQFGYQEIRFPMLEKTEVFARSIGDNTDVVHKEMYSFDDRNGDNLSLRPEGTASCMRANIEHSLTYAQPQRLYYIGPMFRHERPQKGRYRQFHHFGLEAIGFADHIIEAELIQLMTHVWRSLNLDHTLTLELNSLGNTDVRLQHKAALVKYFTQQNALDEDSMQRLHSNPLRILDSKNPDLQDLIHHAPQLIEYFDAASQKHFNQLRALLDTLGIAYTHNPQLVRGLDYYNHTVFEWTTDQLGAQATVCGGGRYDGLMQQMGGRDTPAAGLAMGLERLILLLPEIKPSATDIYVIHDGQADSTITAKAMQLSEQMRAALPDATIITHGGASSFKSQFKQANKANATLAVIVGPDEIAHDTVSIKHLQHDNPQANLPTADLINYLHKHLNSKGS